MIEIHTTSRGPALNATQAHAIVNDFLTEATYAVGQQGVIDVRSQLHGVLKHPTGRYESTINATRSQFSSTVNDRGIIYGPWLEGTGSRNKTTRFKGYATFRKVAQALQRKVPSIIEPALQRLLGRLS